MAHKAAHTLIAGGEAEAIHQILPDGTGVAALRDADRDGLLIRGTGTGGWAASRLRCGHRRGASSQLRAKVGDHLIGRFCRGRVGDHLIGRFCRGGVGDHLIGRFCRGGVGDHLVGRFCHRRPPPTARRP